MNRTWRYRAVMLLFAALIACSVLTFAAFRGVSPLADHPETVIWLLNANLVILLLLSVFLVRRVVVLWAGRKRGLAGSHMHVRLVYIFSLLAAAPVIMMTVASAFLFHYGVQTWFDDRVQGAINSSSAVAEAYLEDHKQTIAGDVRLMADEIDRLGASFSYDESDLQAIVRRQSFVMDLSEAIVFDTEGNVYARTGLTFSLELDAIPSYALQTARTGEIVILTNANNNRVRALVQLRSGDNRFLYVGRLIDPQILSYLQATQDATADYANLRSRYSTLQISVVMIFVVVGVLMLLAAVWLGLVMARQLVQPIAHLVAATDRVRGGDFSVRVPLSGKLEEFRQMAQAFNRMTEQIEAQQGELLQANRELDEKRLLTEAVLKGVPSGVIGLDEHGAVRLANAAAENVLAFGEGTLSTGVAFADLFPEAVGFLEQARMRPHKVSEFEVVLERDPAVRRVYILRIAIEQIGGRDIGAIITIDDVTDIQKNQKIAAWADVARRIAHEIKNPLTPIQLSAERLQRKYIGQIKDDPETFKQCTDMIVRHVGDIGRMVDEFSNFARMPLPKMRRGNLVKIIQETVTLHKQAHRDIEYNFDSFAGKSVMLQFDHQQMRQIFNNVLQNAADSLAESDKGGDKQIAIQIMPYDDDHVAVVVSDNGRGFPAHIDAAQLLEPYITNKTHGTGLGLAIVKKIIDDHEASLYFEVPPVLSNHAEFKALGGATLVMVFQLNNHKDKE